MKKLFNLLDPVLNYIDSGSFFRQPFKWLYYVIGILNFTLPIGMIKSLYQYSDYISGSAIFALILITLVTLAVAIVTCILWVKRASTLNLDATKGARFIAIPVMANFIQTLGEWLGIWIGIGGSICVLIAILLGGEYIGYILPVKISFVMFIAYIIIGYLTVVVFRFMAEIYLSIASIANSTRSIDKKLHESTVKTIDYDNTTDIQD